MTKFQELQNRIVAWRDGKLGDEVDIAGTLAHLIEEAKDLQNNPYDPLSLADVLILWMSVCEYADWNMDEMLEAANAKMAVNESRIWNVDDKGIARHLKETKI